MRYSGPGRQMPDLMHPLIVSRLEFGMMAFDSSAAAMRRFRSPMSFSVPWFATELSYVSTKQSDITIIFSDKVLEGHHDAALGCIIPQREERWRVKPLTFKLRTTRFWYNKANSPARSARALSLQDRAAKDFVLSGELGLFCRGDHDLALTGAIWIMVGVAMIGLPTIASGARNLAQTPMLDQCGLFVSASHAHRPVVMRRTIIGVFRRHPSPPGKATIQNHGIIRLDSPLAPELRSRPS